MRRRPRRLASALALAVSGWVFLGQAQAQSLIPVLEGAGGDVRFLWSGAQLVAECDAGGAVLRRYMHGDSIDRPLVWYEGSAMAGNRRHLYADERGSVLMVRDGSNDWIARHSHE